MVRDEGPHPEKSKADEEPAQSARRGRRGGVEHGVNGRSGRVRGYLEKLPVFSTLAIREPIMGSLLHAFRIRHLDLVLDLKVARHAGLRRQLSCPSGHVPGRVADLHQVVVAGIAQDIHGATIVAIARNHRSRRVLVCAPVEAPEETGHPESKDGNGPLRGRGRPPLLGENDEKGRHGVQPDEKRQCGRVLFPPSRLLFRGPAFAMVVPRRRAFPRSGNSSYHQCLCSTIPPGARTVAKISDTEGCM